VTGTALSAGEQVDLSACETIVEKGLETFIEVGQALAEIRDRRLYRAMYSTFEECAHDRWLLSRTRAYRLIDVAKVDAALSPIGDTPKPANEAQARELAPMLRDEGEEAVVEVWRELRDEFGDDLTAKRVRTTVRKRLKRMGREREAAELREERQELEPKACCDGCGRTEYAAPSIRDGWKFRGHERGSHGDFYDRTYCGACYIASGSAAADARQYADDLDAGRGHCHQSHGWADGRYEWGHWVCSRCEAEWAAAENGDGS
jgi:hypothetical protein